MFRGVLNLGVALWADSKSLAVAYMVMLLCMVGLLGAGYWVAGLLIALIVTVLSVHWVLPMVIMSYHFGIVWLPWGRGALPADAVNDQTAVTTGE